MRRALFVLLFVVAGCGGNVTGADPAQCQPACGAGLACCSEPNHGVTDGGATSSFRCVQPSGSACPLQP